MPTNFDQIINRRGTDSAKWSYYGDEALPLWVADMDFAIPEPVQKALHERINHGIFGYQGDSPELRATIAERMETRFSWQITPENVWILPGLVTGMNAVCRAVGKHGDGVLTFTPIYPPFLTAPLLAGRTLQTAPMALSRENGHLRYEVDTDALEAAITPATKMFMLCNPHNPVGRVYSRAELEAIADVCLRHDLIICADEIHSDLVYSGQTHIPIASLSPEIAQRTVTMIAPSKTFNIAGLYCGAVITENPELLRHVKAAASGIVPNVNVLGYTAALAAYRDGGAWLDELLVYLEGNRDYLLDYTAEHFPQVSATEPEGTYLGWMDWNAYNLPESPYQFFLKEAHVA
ncbi:MAG: putative C-S lyase, partial [Burkholderiales bacterium]|nr:putative C-S lyase [Anaerolineae bacterium]